MKNKDAERPTSQPEGLPGPASEKERESDNANEDRKTGEEKRQKTSRDQNAVLRDLSTGYFPDGPGGSYSGA